MDIIETVGNLPEARFGHTVSLVAKGKVILFGGAVGDTGKFIFSGDSHSFEFTTRVWKKIETTGSAPVPRAAHAAATVEVNQMVVYGGSTGGGSLASDDLYLLDSRGSEGTGLWIIVPVIGQTPGRRYGHSMTYVKPYLIVFGGNTGQTSENDCWCLKVDKGPYTWAKITIETNNKPQARVYHSAAVCTSGISNGMLIVFGGRSNASGALNDAWGLCRHRDGRWDWVNAPTRNKIVPTERYQHSSNFFGKLLVILGGRSNNQKELISMDVYDTESSSWSKFTSAQRFRHCTWTQDNFLFVCGGFDSKQLNTPVDTMLSINLLKLFQMQGNGDNKQNSLANKLVSQMNTTQNTSIDTDSSFSTQKEQQPGNSPNNSFLLTPTLSPTEKQNSPLLNTLNSQLQGNQQRIQTNPNTTQQSTITQFKPPSRQFEFLEPLQAEEKKDINNQMKNNFSNNNNNKNLPNNQITLAKKFIQQLLQPKAYINLPEDIEFPFNCEEIVSLCQQAQEIIKKQPIVIKLRPPLKIFGDIHGQYSDLMRFFDLWGCPSDQTKDGDIDSFDYLFLGDYVDRGSHSLETICLLLALKIEFPNQIHLLRGNHEDKWINNGFGFNFECNQRLGEDPEEENSVFASMNRLFEWMPLAALVGEKILCLHGGIGCSLGSIKDIFTINRPLEIVHEVNTIEEQLVVDILWSDPTDSDQDLGIRPNFPRDPAGTGKIVKFGPDRVSDFLKQNNLSMIIRAHECVMDGFERFAGGKLITVFSATDYCGKHKNAGAILILRNNFEIIPKLIYPVENAVHHTWITNDEQLNQRPLTPPRWVDQNDRRKSYD